MGHTVNGSHRMLQPDWCSDGIGQWRHKIAGDWRRLIHRLETCRRASAHECARFIFHVYVRLWSTKVAPTGVAECEAGSAVGGTVGCNLRKHPYV